MSKIFGIDLGTTFSGVARLDETGQPITLVNAEGDRLTPSVVLFDGDDVVVGKEAMKALANEARLAMKALNAPCLGQSGEPDSGWIVSDYLDLVVHVMLKDTRAYYDLDSLWAKAPRVELPAG